jgi:hypothetical protein
VRTVLFVSCFVFRRERLRMNGGDCSRPDTLASHDDARSLEKDELRSLETSPRAAPPGSDRRKEKAAFSVWSALVQFAFANGPFHWRLPPCSELPLLFTATEYCWSFNVNLSWAIRLATLPRVNPSLAICLSSQVILSIRAPCALKYTFSPASV